MAKTGVVLTMELSQEVLDVLIHFLKSGCPIEVHSSFPSIQFYIKPRHIANITILTIPSGTVFYFGETTVDSSYLLGITNKERISFQKAETVATLLSILYEKEINADFLYLYNEVKLYFPKCKLLEINEDIVQFEGEKFSFLNDKDIEILKKKIVFYKVIIPQLLYDLLIGCFSQQLNLYFYFGINVLSIDIAHSYNDSARITMEYEGKPTFLLGLEQRELSEEQALKLYGEVPSCRSLTDIEMGAIILDLILELEIDSAFNVKKGTWEMLYETSIRTIYFKNNKLKSEPGCIKCDLNSSKQINGFKSLFKRSA